jgi:two-component system sensor histidine kinase BaeS
MTRRLTITILGVVIATLLVVGVGTLAVGSVRARRTTARDLRDHASALVGSLTDTLGAGIDDSTTEAEALRLLRRRLVEVRRYAKVLELDDVALVLHTPRGLQGDLPAGVHADDLDITRLTNGAVESGNAGARVWAAAATAPGPAGRTIIVVVTRKANPGIGAALGWFVVAAGFTLALGIGAAFLLGRRLSRPIVRAGAAAHAIAAGRLDTRLPDPGSDQDEVAELTRAINWMATNLERSKGLEQEFLLSVSHDLRTPLTSIRGYAEAIIDGAGEPSRAAGVILSESRRLERLVADLLDLAKLQSSSFRLDLRPVDLVSTTRSSADGFGPRLAEGGVVLRVVAPAAPVVVTVDPDRVAQVIANLVENASRYARSSVVLTIGSTDGRAVLTVDDDGPGIAPDDLPHVFERLYVSRHQPVRRENSSGLGLAIVRELVTAMGGTVAAGTTPSGGARLAVAFPIAGTTLPPPRLR